MGRMLLLAFLVFGIIVCLCSCDDIAVTRRREGLNEQKQGARRCPGKRLCRRVCERGFKLNSRGCEICQCRESGPRTKPASVDRVNIERDGRDKDRMKQACLSPTPESPAPSTTLQTGNSTGRDGSGRRRYERVTSATNAIQETAECHVETKVITFKDMGWRFVLHPPQFIAGFCRGLCPTVNGSENDIAEKGIARNETLCCSPTKGVPSTTMILYTTEDMNLISRRLPYFIVTECGCTGKSVYQPSNALDALFNQPYCIPTPQQ